MKNKNNFFRERKYSMLSKSIKGILLLARDGERLQGIVYNVCDYCSKYFTLSVDCTLI